MARNARNRPAMSARPVVMYLGGFAKVGGIEAFARDFLLGIAAAYPRRELVIWGRAGRDNRLLEEIGQSGAKISRSPWRWGCLWNLPDLALAPMGAGAVRRASVVIFKRPPPPSVMRVLRRAGGRGRRRIPFVLITPYRPAEYWAPSTKTVLDDFDVITVQSREGIDDLKKLGYRGRSEEIPLLPPVMVEPAPFPCTRDGSLIRLGFLGRLVAQKNLGYLLEIYQRLVEISGDEFRFELHLFGDGAERAQLEAVTAKRALSGVIFHGDVPREKTPAAIDTCDLFLNTSRTEGQCLAALEILGRGRPLVATPVGALPEVLAQPALGRLAPLDDAPAFAASVLEIVREIRAGHLTPSSVATAFARQYDYRNVLQRYLDLLADVAQN